MPFLMSGTESAPKAGHDAEPHAPASDEESIKKQPPADKRKCRFKFIKLDIFDKCLAGILFIALYLRLQLQSVVKAPWWDEASFLLFTRNLFEKTGCTVETHRLPGLSVLLAPVYKIFGAAYSNFQYFEILVSVVLILVVYAISNKLFNGDKRIGLGAAILIAFSWLNLFYGVRVFSRIPSAVFFMISLYLFLDGWEKNNHKLLAIAGVMWAFGNSIRFEGLAIGLSLVLYVALSEGVKALFSRKALIFGLACIAGYVPYLVWSYVSFGNPFFQIYRNLELVSGLEQPRTWFIENMAHIIGAWWAPFLLVGTIALAYVAWTKGIRKPEGKSALFVLLVFLVDFALLSWSPYHEDRYLLVIFPLMAIICAFGLYAIIFIIPQMAVKSFKNNPSAGKVMSAIFFVLVLLFSMQAYSYGKPIILSKGPSYSIVKTAGEKLESFEVDYDAVMGPFVQGMFTHPQLCYSAKNPSKFNWVTYPDNITALTDYLSTPEGSRTLVYYSVYDGNVPYLSPQQFVTEKGGFNQQAYFDYLDKANLTIVWWGNENGTGAISAYLARKQ